MKKTFCLLFALLCSMPVVHAQSALELAKQQQELNEFSMKMLKAKPSKMAKKEAKALKKEGWKVPAGEKPIEMQIMGSQLYGEELMADETGAANKRYIILSSMQTAGSYGAGYAAARANVQVELAAMLKTKIASALQSKIDNAQTSSISAVTVDKFNQRSKFIIDETLTNCIPVLGIYRVLKNNNYQVQVRLAFDKKELTARIKRNLQHELEKEGDKELNGLVDEVLRNGL